MSTSTAIKLTEAVTELIAAIPGAECAVMDLVPDYNLSQIKDLRIIVAPQSFSRGNSGSASRSGPERQIKVNIAVLQKCRSKTDIPRLLILTENIADGIERKSIPGGIILSIDNDPIYDPNIFQNMKIFIAVMTATIKVV